MIRGWKQAEAPICGLNFYDPREFLGFFFSFQRHGVVGKKEG
jgi:hypothetical protein